MSAFWLQLVAALTTWLTQTFGADFADWFSKLFTKEAEKMPEPVIAVGAAPDEVKNLIRGLVLQMVEKALASKPIIKKFVIAIVSNLPDSLIDGIWDSIFMAKIQAGELPVAATFAVKVGAPVAILAEDVLAECKAEAGI